MDSSRRIFALGFFDGVHLGHQVLLRECVALAAKMNCQAAAITFDKHPQSLFTLEPPALISTPSSRELLLRRYGIGPIYKFPVTKEIMSTSWQDFLQELLDFGAVGFVCGDDFRFGSRGEGDAHKLQALCAQRNLPCIVVPEQTVDGIRISSTHIRSLIENGEMETAVQFLGHPHVISGTVVHGKSLGRTLGIPTANLLLEPELAVPKLGVYACRCIVDGKAYPAVTNVGTRPTVSGMGITVESWILDFSGDLYGKQITLYFYKFLRPEQPFPTLEALKQEIHRNAAQTRSYFENREACEK